jgi:CubicO group peptidase (beta-lactamase class C family)
MDNIDIAEFDQFVEKVIEEWKVPGLSIAVVRGDDVWSKVLTQIPIYNIS